MLKLMLTTQSDRGAVGIRGITGVVGGVGGVGMIIGGYDGEVDSRDVVDI